MRVLVTGDRGFIGHHLVSELRGHDHEVFGHDLCDGDLSVPGVFAAALESASPNVVVHLAAQVGRLFNEQDVANAITSNATMTALVAHACGALGVPVVYASTSEVYGDQGDAVCHEGGPLAAPNGIYGLSKLWAEQVLRLYAPGGLKVVRLSMPYGPGAPPGRGRRALDTFLWQAHHRLPITVHRGAERSWCHVSDTARGIRLIVESGTDEVYNVGRDDRPLSMFALAEMCCDLAGAPHGLISEVDAPARQTVVKRLATDRLRSLGWTPAVELEAGLADLYRWIARFDSEGQLAA